jgi:hypothetical protein
MRFDVTEFKNKFIATTGEEVEEQQYYDPYECQRFYVQSVDGKPVYNAYFNWFGYPTPPESGVPRVPREIQENIT